MDRLHAEPQVDRTLLVCVYNLNSPVTDILLIIEVEYCCNYEFQPTVNPCWTLTSTSTSSTINYLSQPSMLHLLSSHSK